MTTAHGEMLSAVDLIDQVRSERATRDAADARILCLAVGWAERHTLDPASPFAVTKSFLEDAPGDRGATPEQGEWLGLPVLRWDTAASFAAALGISTISGKRLIRDALILRHRLPRVWARVVDGEVQVWRARRIAEAVAGCPDDVTAFVDGRVAAKAQEIGPVVLDRLIATAMLHLYAEEEEIRRLAALDARYARLFEESINHTGIAEFVIRGDWADVAAFDDAVAAMAGALAERGCGESLDVRRSMAVGVLADPERALALLNAPTRGSEPAKPRRRAVLSVHLGAGHLFGIDKAGVEHVVLDADARPLFEDAVRSWCGRDDIGVDVKPIRHCGGCRDCDSHIGTDSYRPTSHARAAVELRDRHCVFPFCTRPARSCDCDHVVPFDPARPDRTPTCPCNLAALCRHHHRLKTLAGWAYTMIEPGVCLWADRYGQRFLTSRDGTTDLTERLTARPCRQPGDPPRASRAGRPRPTR